ncbi:hypothetical protein [Plastoroseomonas hellenica]|nr:hypothetical protein [Plastoroseomonas hellenica]MBR0641232.1 hypothetical protein [Plastoroseomonas hellenica]
MSGVVLETALRTIRSSAPVSQACGLTPLMMAVRIGVVATGQFSPPPL